MLLLRINKIHLFSNIFAQKKGLLHPVWSKPSWWSTFGTWTRYILYQKFTSYSINHPLCNSQIRARTHAVLVIGLYELLGNPTTLLIEPPWPLWIETGCYYKRFRIVLTASFCIPTKNGIPTIIWIYPVFSKFTDSPVSDIHVGVDRTVRVRDENAQGDKCPKLSSKKNARFEFQYF
jgi:hypothetical protein